MYVNPGALHKHLQHAHPIYFELISGDDTDLVAQKRATFTNRQKWQACLKYAELEANPTCANPYTETCKWVFGKIWKKRKGYLSKWLSRVGTIQQKIKARHSGAVRPAAYPDCEDELYIRFLFRRTALGYPTNHYWLMDEFAKILKETKPRGWNDFKCSYGWAVRFCKRYSISTQAKTNSKAQDLVEREEAIKKFHRYWLITVQSSEPQTDSKYGRFSPICILHRDQVPLPFASNHSRTLNPVGDKSCRIAGPNLSGLDKRQATLELWICADASRQYVKPTIIFRGSRGKTSRLPKKKEKELYETLTNIRVAFQPNAWADEQFCEEHILRVAEDVRAAGITGEIAIGMDNHSSQRTPNMLNLYSKLGFVPIFTPPECTDCTSPVDHHVGRFIQMHMKASYTAEVSVNPEIWIAAPNDQESEDSNSISAESRRMLLARWLSDAWTEVCTNHQHLIKQAFIATGFLIAKDGSEDHLINLQGWTGPESYSFRG